MGSLRRAIPTLAIVSCVVITAPATAQTASDMIGSHFLFGGCYEDIFCQWADLWLAPVGGVEDPTRVAVDYTYSWQAAPGYLLMPTHPLDGAFSDYFDAYPAPNLTYPANAHTETTTDAVAIGASVQYDPQSINSYWAVLTEDDPVWNSPSIRFTMERTGFVAAEPGTVVLLGFGLLVLGLFGLRLSKKAA